MKIPFLIPEFPPLYSYILDLAKIHRNRIFSNKGEYVNKFENKLWDYLGRKNSQKPVCVNNATIGLIVALKVLNLPKNSKVLVPSWTFPASVEAIIYAGLEPVFCDIDEDTHCIKIDHNLEKLENVSAIMPVCAYGNDPTAPAGRIFKEGYPIGSNHINEFAKKHNLKVVVDAAGAICNLSRSLVANADAVVYSFHATKMLSLGEGGCMLFKTKDDEARARRLIDFGMDITRECQEVGLNGKMSEHSAAIGIQSLKRLKKIITRRYKIIDYYNYEVLFDYVKAGKIATNKSNGKQLFTITCETNQIKELIEFNLNKAGIETRVYYNPCHKQKAFKGINCLGLPNYTDSISNRVLSLPLYSKLTNGQLKYIKSVFDKLKEEIIK